LSRIRTSAVPSGERGGAELGGSARSRASSVFFAFEKCVAFSADHQQSAAELHIFLDIVLAYRRMPSRSQFIENHQLVVR